MDINHDGLDRAVAEAESQADITTEQAMVYSEGSMTGEQLAAEMDQPPPTPTMIWSFGFDAEETLAVYAALRTYLRALVNQDEEDLEMIGRITKILSQMKPGAVKASKSLALNTVRMEDKE